MVSISSPGRDVLDLVEDEALATDHPAPADVEHLHRGLELVVGDADHVDVLGACRPPSAAWRWPCAPLSSRSRSRAARSNSSSSAAIAHLGLEPLDDGVGVAVEEVDAAPAPARRSRSLVDLAHARARALLDVEQQARPAQLLVAAELVVRAGADREGAQQQVERLADGVGVAVGAEVAHALALAAPHDHGPGPLVAHGDGQERVALVVDQADVEPGLVLLDEAVLEHQRLDVVADLDPLDRLGRGHHLGGAGRQVPGFWK